MKRSLSIIASLMLAVSSIAPLGHSLAVSVGVTINGQPVQFTEETGVPFIDENSRTQVPLRVTMEAYGCAVGWDAGTRTAIVSKDGVTVTAPIGQPYITRDGTVIQNDTAAVIVDSRTYLPIRAVLEAFGATVGWDATSATVIIANSGSASIDTQESTSEQQSVLESEPAPSPAAAATMGERNALFKAQSYLRTSAFSYSGLIKQLEYNKFTTEEATYGADNCGADWNEQALKKAQSYLRTSAFSYSGLVEQLEYNGFTEQEAAYGADNCGADWYEQAAKKAESYLSHSSFSRDGLIHQLEYNGFTAEQAEYGVSQNGY